MLKFDGDPIYWVAPITDGRRLRLRLDVVVAYWDDVDGNLNIWYGVNMDPIVVAGYTSEHLDDLLLRLTNARTITV